MKTLALILSLAAPVAWGGQMDYSPAAFQQAQNGGKKIVLQFHADWCPVCVKQQKALSAISSSQKDIEIFKADFDKEKELKMKFGVRGQSTLIFFRGEKEIARNQGETDQTKIEANLMKLGAM